MACPPFLQWDSLCHGSSLTFKTPSEEAHFESLKNLRDVIIRFQDKGLTAILGPNGCGKSTVLHALASCFPKYPYYYFFLPTEFSQYRGSRLTIVHSFTNKINGERYSSIRTTYYKNERWGPPKNRKPVRDVFYISIATCVPEIERETRRSKVNYIDTQTPNINQRLLKDASSIMNRDYEDHVKHLSDNQKTHRTVTYKGTQYSSLSMGVGEQRLFSILEQVYSAPDYSLILVDELNLLLHESALSKLIKRLIDLASQRKLQIVFTTHAREVLAFESEISIRHIRQKEAQTLCFERTHPDAIYRLTGKQETKLKVCVEDDLAKTIISKVCKDLNIFVYVSINECGPAKNCFSTLAGLLLIEGTRIKYRYKQHTVRFRW